MTKRQRKKFTSDIHVNHANIIDYVPRPFQDVDHMAAEIARRWNENVDPDDDVILVGDAAMGDRKQSLEFFRRVLGNLYLVPGNHDHCWSGAPGNVAKHAEWIRLYEQYFTLLPEQHKMTLVGEDGFEVEVLVCHFPYHAIERHGSRYSAWEPQADGLWLLHGHTHLTTSINVERKQIHVGTDAWDYTPVPEEWIVQMIQENS